MARKNFSAAMSSPITNVDYPDYPYIKNYSQSEGIAKDLLAQAFEVEQYYHNRLLKEKDFGQRQLLYTEFYSRLLLIYGRHEDASPVVNPKDKTVQLFSRELKNQSIIDFGCGQGYMLQSIARQLNTKYLSGVDVLIPQELKSHKKIVFQEGNVITYKPTQKFDVAISDNVLEHLVPEDASLHLKSMYEALNDHGKLILIMPNKLFGPADITRIKDFSHSGKLPPEGGHVNESTYTDMIEALKAAGFQKFSTVLPIPKFKYTFLRNARVGISWIKTIENSRFFLKLFRSIKVKGVCPIRFTVTLIAEK